MIAESFNVKKTLISDPERPLPDSFHNGLGLKLPVHKSLVYEQLHEILEYAEENEMRLNFSKTQFISFNPTRDYDYEAGLEVAGKEIETVDQMNLVGLILTNDLKWKQNADFMTKKAYAKLWIVKRLKIRGANLEDMIDIYCKQVRSILEFGVPVFNHGLTLEEVSDIERVQKSFLQIALGKKYCGYENALELCELETLEERRLKLCK